MCSTPAIHRASGRATMKFCRGWARSRSSQATARRRWKTLSAKLSAHACNRATARERQSYHTYQAQEAPATYAVLSKLPERDIGSKRRAPPPAETHVLVGWYKDEAHLKWVLAQKLYNFRMDTKAGSLRLTPEVSGAQYLLLHSYKGKTSSGLFRVAKEGPRVLSRETSLS